MDGHDLTSDNAPRWYQTAVFYEVLVRSFQDSNGDGVGDLRGLHSQLDYLEWLGVDCLWLPPFYPSPLRDGGYDISDLTNVHPQFGTLDDFKSFLEAAHEREVVVGPGLVAAGLQVQPDAAGQPRAGAGGGQ